MWLSRGLWCIAFQVILVSINYRLNAFGFMALNELSKHDARGVSGNYGVTDMIASLQVCTPARVAWEPFEALLTLFECSGSTRT
jgi:hypothetical protein